VVSVVSANVNGVRAALRRGGFDWLKSSATDIWALQEVRATREEFDQVLAQAELLHLNVAHSESVAKGRAGVAVVTGLPISDVRIDLPGKEFVGSGRWVEADVTTNSGPITVISTYVHTGEAEDEMRQAEKMRFLGAIEKRMKALVKREAATGVGAVLTGDLNIAHREVDIKNWKGNLNKAGFLPQERAVLERWFSRLNLVDLGRDLGGPGPGPYTWWSWRGQAFDNDAGWRIDFQIATPDLATRAHTASVARAATYAERWSDHAPLTVEFGELRPRKALARKQLTKGSRTSVASEGPSDGTE
jgi:exodeoxyribonuclease-3